MYTHKIYAKILNLKKEVAMKLEPDRNIELHTYVTIMHQPLTVGSST